MFRLSWGSAAPATGRKSEVFAEILYRRPYHLPACISVPSGPPGNESTRCAGIIR
jgi:hypothetical protein